MASVLFNGFGAFIVHHVEGGVIIARGKSRKDLGEGVNHGTIILGGHGAHKDGIDIIYIRNKNILHQLEGADVEGTRQIGVHGARGEVGKGREAENIVGGAHFFGGVQVVDLELRIKNGRLDGARGLGALPLAAMWSLLVAVESGRWLRLMCNEKPGIVANSLLRSSVRSNVVAGGEQRAWWINHVYSVAVEVTLTLVAILVGGCAAAMLEGVVVAVKASGINHNPVHVHLLAHRTMQPRCKMVHPILVNRISHPALHSMTTKMREWDAKLGMMWACVGGKRSFL